MNRVSIITRRFCKCISAARRQTNHSEAVGSRIHVRNEDVEAFSLLNTLKHDGYKHNSHPWRLELSDTLCKVVKVYDGDSITLAWVGSQGPNYANCRMYGIDTPELKSKDAMEKRAAEECRDRVRDAVLNQIMTFTTQGATGLDKYGRPLVIIKPHCVYTASNVRDLIRPHGTLNMWILNTDPVCKAYYGGKKEPFAQA